MLSSAPRGSIRVRFSSFCANLSRTSRAGGILRLWALYEHVLWRLLRPRSREGESPSFWGFLAPPPSELTFRRQHRAQRSRRCGNTGQESRCGIPKSAMVRQNRLIVEQACKFQALAFTFLVRVV